MAAVVVVAGIGWLAWSVIQNNRTGIDGSKYQAVFLTNGQVYFGKLHTYTSSSMELTNIFYLQAKSGDTTQASQQTANSTSDVQLIKLGNEVYGPQDQMVIPKSQVLYYENLNGNSRVVQTIQKYYASH